MHKEDTILSAVSRSSADRAQDIPRRAASTLRISTLSPEHDILELEPGRGWFTDILLCLTAERGSLTVQQPAALDAFFSSKARQRLIKSKHPRTSYSDAPWDKLSPQDSSIDRVVWLQGPHELQFALTSGMELGTPKRVFSEIARVLRPDGRLLIVDNLAPAGMSANEAGILHRSHPTFLKEAIEDAGLVLEIQDEQWIFNKNDPLTVPTYSAEVHLKTHQFLQIFRNSGRSAVGT